MLSECPHCGQNNARTVVDLPGNVGIVSVVCACGRSGEVAIFNADHLHEKEFTERLAVNKWNATSARIVAERSRVRELEEIVLRLEYSAAYSCCPDCGGCRGISKHAEDCKLGAACARIRKEREHEHASNDQVH